MRYAFTFDTTHTTWPNIDLGHRYVVISGTWNSAREKLIKVRGDKFAFQYPYDTKFEQMIMKHNLVEINYETLAFNE